MALDPSIILQGRTAQIESPTNALARVLQIQGAQNQNDHYRRQAEAEQRNLDDQNRLRALLAEGGNDDPTALASKLTKGGFLPQAQSVIKTAGEDSKNQREADKAKFGLYVDKFNHGIQLLGNVQNPEQAQQWLGWQVQNGLMPMQAAQQQQIPTDPAGFAKWREGMQRTGLTAQQHFKDQLERLQFGETQQHNRTTEGISRGQLGVAQGNLGVARERLQLDRDFPQGQVVDTAGGLMIVDPRGRGARPVTGADGKPVQGKPAGGGNATEDQSKAAGWLAQATNAFNNMTSVLDRNPDAAKPGVGDAVSRVPGMKAVGNYLTGDERQLFNQGASSLSEALLRAATGAGVNENEARQKVEELTPQFGDSAAVRKQKRDAIPVYLNSLRVRAGRAGQQTVPPAAPAATAPGAPVSIDALVNQYLPK